MSVSAPKNKIFYGLTLILINVHSEIAKKEHPLPPEYPFTNAINNLAYNMTTSPYPENSSFGEVIKKFFGNYFSDDADLGKTDFLMIKITLLRKCFRY